MNDRWMARGFRALAMVMTFGAVAACERAADPVQPDPLAGLARGIHPVVVVGARSGDTTTVQLLLHRVEVTEKVASFQGQVAFDAGALTVAGATLPAGVMGAWNQPEAGRVRFAGAALEGMPDEPILVMKVLARGPVEAAMFQFSVEEITTADGFRDVTSQLVSPAPAATR